MPSGPYAAINTFYSLFFSHADHKSPFWVEDHIRLIHYLLCCSVHLQCSISALSFGLIPACFLIFQIICRGCTQIFSFVCPGAFCTRDKNYAKRWLNFWGIWLLIADVRFYIYNQEKFLQIDTCSKTIISCSRREGNWLADELTLFLWINLKSNENNRCETVVKFYSIPENFNLHFYFSWRSVQKQNFRPRATEDHL